MKRNWIVGGATWAAIVALAWWLADRRIQLCGYAENACILRATATRDDILVRGLSFALAALLLFFVFRWITTGSRHASERLVDSYSPHRSAVILKALRVRIGAMTFRRRWVIPTTGAIALAFLLGWHLRGERHDPYAAFATPVPEPAAIASPTEDPLHP